MNGTITSRMPADDYTAVEALRISYLKELKRSPLHYRHRLAHQKESPALRLGSAAHCAVLEPERFYRDHAVWSRRTESGRMAPRNGKAWDAFQVQHEGRTILTADEHDHAQAIQAAVRNHPLAAPYLVSGDPEVVLQWDLDGRPCRGRVDWLTNHTGKPVIVGLKTARDCRYYLFGTQAAKLGYHLQWAWYFDGHRAITGEAPEMVEIVVESDPPHAVAVYSIPYDIIEQGRDEYMALLKILDDCEANDSWPGPVTEVQIMTLPSWVYEQHDDISDLGLEAG